MRNIKFWKIQASGNDFILVDKKTFYVDKAGLSNFIVNICKRKTGVGADGFIILEKLSDKKLSWDFFNSDASTAEMCGNASRAVTKFFVEVWNGKAKSELSTGGGLVGLEYLSAVEMKVTMSKQDLCGDENGAFVWNTGVPHIVFEKDLSSLENLKTFAVSKRYPSLLNNKGANVSFWQEDSGSYKSISFERGVEDFTLACGTGATACGLDILKKKKLDSGEIKLDLPGGTVKVLKKEGRLFLIGDASVVYEGYWSKNEN